MLSAALALFFLYSGQIRVANPVINYETLNRYELIVMAQDDGFPRSNDTALVIITILDANDRPEFRATMYQVRQLAQTPISFMDGRTCRVHFSRVARFMLSGHSCQNTPWLEPSWANWTCSMKITTPCPSW